MGHRLITWWNPNNAWHRAAAEAALKAIGARWLPRDADEEGQEGRPVKDGSPSPAGDDIQPDDRFPRSSKRGITAAVYTVATVKTTSGQAT